MVETNNPDLNLYAAGQEGIMYTWILNPPLGRNSFRIVVHSRRPLHAASPKRQAWSRNFGAITHVVLTILTFWRTGH
jgi:hypothetical protein